jgi:hypothetical protein
VADFMGKRKLGNFGGHSAIVIYECDDARVQTSLRALVDSPYGLRVRFVLLADSSRRT